MLLSVCPSPGWGEGANVHLYTFDEGAKLMSLHDIFGQGANVRGGTYPSPETITPVCYSFWINPVYLNLHNS